MDMRTKQRHNVIQTVINELNDSGWNIVACDYGDGDESYQGYDLSDEERIYFSKKMRNGEGKRVTNYSWVYFVYDNNPEEIICDFTTNIELVMNRVYDKLGI